MSQKIAKFHCEYCKTQSNNKHDFNKHLLTAKHQKMINGNILETQKSQLDNIMSCQCCTKMFQSRTGLWKHKKICPNEPSNKDLIMLLINENSELKNMMMKVIETGTHNITTTNTNNNHNTNSHNKSFNLNFFLNETCKNAMNISEFVESIKLQLSDLIDVGDAGFVEGISRIIVSRLSDMDETVRPIHCTDKKRETVYIKDENKWEKSDDNKTKLRNAIKKVASKNVKLLPQFREKHPDYNNSNSVISDKYCKMVYEAFTYSDMEKENKIIHNISKNVVISKYN